MNEFDEIMEEENVVEEFESGRDYSTAIGAGAIAVAGVLLYEGGKRGFKYAKIGVGKLKDKIVQARAAKAKPADEPETAEEEVEK